MTKDYIASYSTWDDSVRHISIRGSNLCGVKKGKEFIDHSLKGYSSRVKLCKKCINKLPKKTKEEVLFQTIVNKLKKS